MQRNITNTIALKCFYNSLLLSRIHDLPKVWQEIIFVIYGNFFVSLERIYYLEERSYAITPLDERDTVVGLQVGFIEGGYPIFFRNFFDSLKTHIDQAPRIQDICCCRYWWTEDRSVVPESDLILIGRILVISFTCMWSVALFFKHQDLILCIGLRFFEAWGMSLKSINNLQDPPTSRCISNHG